jgi:tetratricopeptide (TPR) repeat protein
VIAAATGLLSHGTAFGMPSRFLEQQMSLVDSLIYTERDYDSGLRICKEVADMPDVAKAYTRKAAALIDLIENYSDYDREPLRLFFDASRAGGVWFGGRTVHTREERLRREDLYRELLSSFPDSRIAGYVQYLLGAHYVEQIGTNDRLRYLDREEARQKAIDSFRRVQEQYPHAVFPAPEYRCQAGAHAPIAPFAQRTIAWLYEEVRTRYSGTHRLADAIREYRVLIERFPEVEDREGHNLAVSAWVSILKIYMGWRRPSGHAAKAAEVCRILLDEYENQRYEVPGWLFGYTHPEAYLQLASLAADKDSAVALCRKVIRDYPGNWSGKSHSCGAGPYAGTALSKIISLVNDPHRAIEECRHIVASMPDTTARGIAQYRLARIYEQDLGDYERALAEYQTVLEDYGEVYTGGERTLGDGATSAIAAIREKLAQSGAPTAGPDAP